MDFPRIRRVDEQLFNLLITEVTHPGLITSARWLSRSGDGVWYLVVGLLALVVGKEQGEAFFVACLAAYLVERPIYFILKQGVKRHRPMEVFAGLKPIMLPSDRFSMPSGHTAAAFVMATMLSWYFPMITPYAFVWAGLVGMSRIVLRVHFPVDVLCGAFLGSAVAWSVIALSLS